MKRIFALAVTAALALCLTACSGGQSGSGDSGSSSQPEAATTQTQESATPAQTETAETSSGESTSGELTTVDPGKLTISTSPDFAPYEFTDDAGNIVGIEPEIMGLIAEKLGLELQVDAMDFKSALLAVQQGKSDAVVSGVTVLEERKLVMDFTDSYTTAVQVVVVPEGSDVTLDNLGEKSIGVQQGTTGQIFCEDDFGEDHVVAYSTYSLVIQALLNGQVDCVVMDNGPAQVHVNANPGLEILDTEYVTEEYAFGITKDNTPLLDAINTALRELIDDGSVQRIIDSYISD